MTIVIAGIGIIIAGVSLLALVLPEVLLSLARRMRVSTGLRITAGVVRIALGACLVLAAGQTRFPLLVGIFGWITLVAGVALLLIGNALMQRVVGWFTSRLAPPWVRVAGVAGIALGTFLVFASV